MTFDAIANEKIFLLRFCVVNSIHGRIEKKIILELHSLVREKAPNIVTSVSHALLSSETVKKSACTMIDYACFSDRFFWLPADMNLYPGINFFRLCLGCLGPWQLNKVAYCAILHECIF